MVYEEIPIVETALRCGLLYGENTNKVEIKINCPFCTDKRKRFFLNTRKNQFCCHNCGVGGNSVTLYAMRMGLDNKTASKDLLESIVRILPISSQKPMEQEDCCEPSTLLERHKVYNDLLNLCTLSQQHQTNLLNRGLSLEVIDQLQYKTIPDWKTSDRIASQLANRHQLLGIPGFYTENGQWRMMKRKGFFVPMRTKDGCIQGLQLRLDGEIKNKYKWFTSRYNENGSRAYSWVHVIGWNGQKEVIITEGGLKASVAWFLTEGQCFLAVPGVNCIDKVVPTLRELNISNANIAFDMDYTENVEVAKAIEKLMLLLRKAGITYRQYKWEPEYKGIDDLLWHRHMERQAA